MEVISSRRVVAAAIREGMSEMTGEGRDAKAEHHASLRSSSIFQGTEGEGNGVYGKEKGMV